MPTIDLFDALNHENNQIKHPASQFFINLLESNGIPRDYFHDVMYCRGKRE
jgi:hypothetical protein